MKRRTKQATDWLPEVWRVKEELSAEARRMGTRKYVAFLEQEAARIAKSRIWTRTCVPPEDR